MTSEDPAERGGGERLLKEGKAEVLAVRNQRECEAGDLEARQGHYHGLVFIVNLTQFRILRKAVPLDTVVVQTDALTAPWCG